MDTPQPDAEDTDTRLSTDGATPASSITRWGHRLVCVLWPRLRDVWMWCTEWTAGLTVWGVAGVSLLVDLILRRWKQFRFGRQSEHEFPDDGDTAGADPGFLTPATDYRAAIGQRRVQFLAGPHREAELSHTKRVVVSAALLLVGWYCFPSTSSETAVRLDNSPTSPESRPLDTDHSAVSVVVPEAAPEAGDVAAPIAAQLAEADRMRREALEGLHPDILAAIQNPDADLKSVIDRLARQAKSQKQSSSQSAEILATLKEFEPDVIAAISKAAFSRKFPRARLTSRNVDDGLENYIWGDSIAENHAVIVDDVLIGFRTSFFRGDRRTAERSIDEIVTRLGVPTSQERSPQDPPSVVRVALWNFDEIGFSLRCTVRKGSVKNGGVLYWFERGVSNVGLLQQMLSKKRDRAAPSRHRPTAAATGGSYSRVRDRVRGLLKTQTSTSKVEAEASTLIELAKRAGYGENAVLKLLNSAETDARRRGLNTAFAVSAVKGSLSFLAASDEP